MCRRRTKWIDSFDIARRDSGAHYCHAIQRFTESNNGSQGAEVPRRGVTPSFMVYGTNVGVLTADQTVGTSCRALLTSDADADTAVLAGAVQMTPAMILCVPAFDLHCFGRSFRLVLRNCRLEVQEQKSRLQHLHRDYSHRSARIPDQHWPRQSSLIEPLRRGSFS